MSELPKGWIVVTLGEVCSKPQYGYTTKSCPEGRVQYLSTTDLSSGKVNWGTVPYCLTEPDKVDKYQLEHNDILISRAGAVGQGRGYRVQGTGCRVQGAGYRVQGTGCAAHEQADATVPCSAFSVR